MFNQVYRFEKEDILTISHWFLPVNLFTAVATIFETTENCQCQQLTPLPFIKQTCGTMIFKTVQPTSLEKILNIKPCIGQITVVWELFIREC